MKKKSIKTVIILTLILSVILSACGQKSNLGEDKKSEDAQSEDVLTSETSMNLAALKGPTTIGLIKMIDKYGKIEEEKNSTFTMYQTADEIAAGLSKGEIDIAAIPANLAATLYNKTDGDIQVGAINTLGVLYIVENGNTIERPEDLNGKTIYSVGKGTTPEGVLDSFIKGHNLKNVNIEYKNEASEIAGLLKTNKDVIAMLPEPFVTVAEENNSNIKVLFNMNKEWMDLHDGDLLVTGVLVARKEFIENHEKEFEEFLETYERSIKYTMTNVEETAKLAENAGIIPPGLGEKAIPRTNIVYIDGEDMEGYLSKYLNILYSFNENLVGGSLPDEDFYYKK